VRRRITTHITSVPRLSPHHLKFALLTMAATAVAHLGVTIIAAATPVLTFVEFQQDGVGIIDGLDGAISVTVSPDGKNIYAAGFNDNAVAVFSRNSTTGALTFVEIQKDGVGTVDGLFSAVSVTVSPDGNNVYAAGLNDAAVAVFNRPRPRVH
jgi:DNA-binding beta-propeller fold protein YncE